MSLYFVKRKKALKKCCVALSLFALATVLFFLLSRFSKSFLIFSGFQNSLILLFLVSVLFALAFKPLDQAFSRFITFTVFKKKTYSQMTLLNLAEELTLTLDLNELANSMVNTFGELLHLQTVSLVIPNKVREDFEIISAYGWNLSECRKVRLRRDSALMNAIHSGGPHVMVRDRAVKLLSWQEANALAKDLDTVRASWVIPLFVRNEEFTGALCFSALSADTVFDEGDFQFFRQFGSLVAKALRNALSVLELRTANEELQDVQAQLLQATKLTAIEQLATGIAHEIHNPLTIISGKAQVLLLQKERTSMDDRVEEVLKTIVKQTKRAADITRKLLMFSQGSGSPKEMLRLDQVLEDTLSLVSYQTSLEGIEITQKIGVPLPSFYANVHEMREVFLNLILNAVQSVGSQGKIFCEINGRPQDQLIEISISDTGSGIPADVLQKVFNPFFTTRPDAVGLGLFVTKQIVHRYGGSIRAQSRPDEGTLFVIQLPYMEIPGPMTADSSSSLSLFPV